MEEIAAYGLAVDATAAESAEVVTKSADLMPKAMAPDLANKVLSEFRKAPFQSEQWLRSLARTERAEVYFYRGENECFFYVFEDRSFVIFGHSCGEDFAHASTAEEEEIETMRNNGQYQRLFG